MNEHLLSSVGRLQAPETPVGNVGLPEGTGGTGLRTPFARRYFLRTAGAVRTYVGTELVLARHL